MRLRAGDRPPDELSSTREFARELAQTNEALVALNPNRQDRRSAAFVAATAYQLVYQIDSLSAARDTPAHLNSTSIAPVVGAMLLFLVAESSADATEVARRVRLPAPSLERELILTLVDLARGQLRRVTQRALPSAENVAQSFGPDAASSALYHLILRAVRKLAADLSGFPTDTDDAPATLRRVQELAAPFDDPPPPLARELDSLELGSGCPIARSFPLGESPFVGCRHPYRRRRHQRSRTAWSPA